MSNDNTALLKQLAEQMVRSRKKNWERIPENRRRGLISNQIPNARIAVEHIEERTRILVTERDAYKTLAQEVINHCDIGPSSNFQDKFDSIGG